MLSALACPRILAYFMMRICDMAYIHIQTRTLSRSSFYSANPFDATPRVLL